jgi:adenylate cyclase
VPRTGARRLFGRLFGSVENPSSVAQVKAYRGEIDEAFAWLERAYEARDSGLSNVLSNPWLANLHDDPRWEELITKLGLAGQ